MLYNWVMTYPSGGEWYFAWQVFLGLSAVGAVLIVLGLTGLLSLKCPKCRGKLRGEKTIKDPAAPGRPGRGVVTYTCARCGFVDTKEFTVRVRRQPRRGRRGHSP